MHSSTKLIVAHVSDRGAFAAQHCPKEKRTVCVEETIVGHTFKHPALVRYFNRRSLNQSPTLLHWVRPSLQSSSAGNSNLFDP